MNILINNDNAKIKLLNVLFSLIPVGFIVGNLFLNLNIFFFIIFAFIFYQEKIFFYKKNYIDKIIYFFFTYTILVALVNLIESTFIKFDTYNFVIIQKTFLYLRYFFLYIILRYLIEKNLINFKWFFISISFLCLFISADIIYQFFFQKDIFGYEIINIRKLSGPFGSELIAGGYLQRFFLFFIFLILNYFIGKKKNFFIITFTVLIFTAMLLAGNRMSLLLLLLTIFLLFMFEKRLRAPILLILSVGVFVFVILYNNVHIGSNKLSADGSSFQVHFKANYHDFLRKIKQLSNAAMTLKIDRKKLPDQFDEFESFYGTWKMNKYIGGGIRSFRINCPHKINNNVNVRFTCNTHPHNYYLEILTDLGLLGLIIISILFFSILYNTFIKKYFFKTRFFEPNILAPFIFIFITEIFPLKSTGSFFTTSNSTFLFLIISVLVGLSEKKINK